MQLTINGRHTDGDNLYVNVTTDEVRPKTLDIGPFSVMGLSAMTGEQRRAAFIQTARRQLLAPTPPPPGELDPGQVIDIGV